MRNRRLLLVLGPVALGCCLLVTAAGASIRTSTYRFSDVAVQVVDLPDPVTAGNLAAYDVTVANLAGSTATDTTATISIPGATSLYSVTTNHGACAQAASSVVCALGSLPRGTQASIRMVVVAPGSAGSISAKAKVHATERDPNTADNQDSQATSVVTPSTDSRYGFVPAAGGTVSTGGGTSRSNPQSTTVKMPPTSTGGAVSILEEATGNPSASCGLGYVCVGQIVHLDLTGATIVTTRPVRMTMRIDSSALGGADGSTLPVFRNRGLISNCLSPGTAKPAPCVESRTVLSGGDVKIVVLTVQGGRYRA